MNVLNLLKDEIDVGWEKRPLNQFTSNLSFLEISRILSLSRT